MGLYGTERFELTDYQRHRQSAYHAEEDITDSLHRCMADHDASVHTHQPIDDIGADKPCAGRQSSGHNAQQYGIKQHRTQKAGHGEEDR